MEGNPNPGPATRAEAHAGCGTRGIPGRRPSQSAEELSWGRGAHTSPAATA